MQRTSFGRCALSWLNGSKTRRSAITTLRFSTSINVCEAVRAHRGSFRSDTMIEKAVRMVAIVVLLITAALLIWVIRSLT